MKQNENILDKAARRDGMTVPEGFFNDFVAKMSESLPERPEAERSAVVLKPRTTWNRVRTYVYMAAMFAGIWCMLKVFTLMNPVGVDLSVDRNRVLTEALGDDNFVYDYLIDDVNNRDIFDEMYDDSILVEDMVPADNLIDVADLQSDAESGAFVDENGAEKVETGGISGGGNAVVE